VEGYINNKSLQQQPTKQPNMTSSTTNSPRAHPQTRQTTKRSIHDADGEDERDVKLLKFDDSSDSDSDSAYFSADDKFDCSYFIDSDFAPSEDESSSVSTFLNSIERGSIPSRFSFTGPVLSIIQEVADGAADSDVPDKKLLHQQLGFAEKAKKLGFGVIEKSEIDNVIKERKRLKSDKKDLTRVIRKLENEIEKLHDSSEKRDADNTMLNHKNGTLKAEITDLRDQLQELHTQIQTQTLTTIEGKEDEVAQNQEKEYQEDITVVGEDEFSTDTSLDITKTPTKISLIASVSLSRHMEILQVVNHLKGLLSELAGYKQLVPASSELETYLPQVNSLSEQIHTLANAMFEFEQEVSESERLLNHGSEWSHH
jgi:regulator of replication initiation timing